MPRRPQARWPARTPGGLGGQFRPEGLDVDSPAARLLLGAALLVDNSPRDVRHAALPGIRALNKAAGKQAYDLRGHSLHDTRVIRDLIEEKLWGPLSYGETREMASTAIERHDIHGGTLEHVIEAAAHAGRATAVTSIMRGLGAEDGPPDSPARSPAGRLRNFRAMSDAKLENLRNDMEQDDHGDAEAMSAIQAEAARRGMGGPATQSSDMIPKVPPPGLSSHQVPSHALAEEIVASGLRRDRLTVESPSSGRYARIIHHPPRGRKRTIAYVRHATGPDQITFTRGTHEELTPGGAFPHLERGNDAIGVRGAHYSFDRADPRAIAAAARALGNAVTAASPGGASSRAEPSTTPAPQFQTAFSSAEAFANHIVQHANAQLPGEETSGFTVQVPPSGDYARIVHPDGGTAAYVRPNTGRARDGHMLFRTHRVTFTRGHDETVTGGGLETSSGQAASVRNGLTVKIRTPYAPDAVRRPDREVEQVARNLLLVRGEPRRQASGEPRRASRRSRRPAGEPGQIVNEGGTIGGGFYAGRPAENHYVVGGMPGIAAGDDNMPPVPSDGERNFGVEIEFRGLTVGQAAKATRDAGLPVDNFGDRYVHSSNLRAFSVAGDPSISGIEVTTPPLRGRDGEELLKKWVGALKAAGGKQGSQIQEGNHVHVDMRDLNAKQVKAVERTYENNKDIIDELVAVTRRPAQYAGGQSARVGPGHSSALNTEHAQRFVRGNAGRGTFEFRRLGSNVSPDEVHAWAVMVREIVERAKRRGTAMPSQGTLSALIDQLGLPADVKRVLLRRAARVGRQRRR